MLYDIRNHFIISKPIIAVILPVTDTLQRYSQLVINFNFLKSSYVPLKIFCSHSNKIYILAYFFINLIFIQASSWFTSKLLRRQTDERKTRSNDVYINHHKFHPNRLPIMLLSNLATFKRRIRDWAGKRNEIFRNFQPNNLNTTNLSSFSAHSSSCKSTFKFSKIMV